MICVSLCSFYEGAIESYSGRTKVHKVSEIQSLIICYSNSVAPLLELWIIYLFPHTFGLQVVYTDGESEELHLHKERWELLEDLSSASEVYCLSFFLSFFVSPECVIANA